MDPKLNKNDENVLVAVRVRPFNDREVARSATCIIDMDEGKNTLIRNPKENDTRTFTYDYSFEGTGDKSSDQTRILCAIILDNAVKGYNVCNFLYGQTGSGKSYSMKGIVTMLCEELFKSINDTKHEIGAQFQVCISMFEIYCEKIRDLLGDDDNGKINLKLREHPKHGFYVENLKSQDVESYKDIEKTIDKGRRNQTIESTKMNKTSSRAHTIVRIIFKQKIPKKSGGGTITKTSEINLVAGSERQKNAENEGQRLKEGIMINKSLTTLGRVIKSLIEVQNAKNKKRVNIQIPYRDSVLTSVLKQGLGGNSKTIMLATISPADINYFETLSTLQFASRVKSIKTNAVINESLTDRLIRELQDENGRLKDLIEKGVSVDGKTANEEEIEHLKKTLEKNMLDISNLETTWKERLLNVSNEYSNASELTEQKKLTQPFLWNLNEDAALSNRIIHFIENDENIVTNSNENTAKNKIVLQGISILPLHATINKKNKKIFIKTNDGAKVLINGINLYNEIELRQNDRVSFGGNHLYVFRDPKREGVKKVNEVSYDMAQIEIAKNQGFANKLQGNGHKTEEEFIIEEELITLIPYIHRANLMAKELKSDVVYEIVFVSGEIKNDHKSSIVSIKSKNEKEDIYFIWSKDKFMSRYYDMQAIFQDYIESGTKTLDINKWDYPFFESPKNSDILIGTCNIALKSLSKLLDFTNEFPIFDIDCDQVGVLTVSLVACSVLGVDIIGEYIEKSEDIIGKSVGFKIKLLTASVPKRIAKCWATYKFYEEPEQKTLVMKGVDVVFAHEKVFFYKPVTKKLLNYIQDNFLVIKIYGCQKIRYSHNAISAMPIIEQTYGPDISQKVAERKVEQKMGKMVMAKNEISESKSKNAETKKKKVSTTSKKEIRSKKNTKTVKDASKNKDVVKKLKTNSKPNAKIDSKIKSDLEKDKVKEKSKTIKNHTMKQSK